MIKSGFKYKIISVISDGVMSTFNSISMYFLVIADIITHKSPTKQFSYGFKRATVICTLGLSILLILVSINLIGTAIESLISEENDESENVPSDIINLALISLLVNTFGLVFVGGSEKMIKKVEKCELSGGLITIISDLISAGSIVLNNYLIVYHNIKFLDPYLSLFSSLLILVMTLKEMKEVVSILNLKTSNDISLDFLINESDENLDNSLNIWKLDEETDVVSLKLKITDKNDYGKTLDMISNSLTEKNIEYYTIEIENIYKHVYN